MTQDQLNILRALGGFQQNQNQNNTLSSSSQMGMNNQIPQRYTQQQQQPQQNQYQQPSWMDLLNQKMMMGSMMPQQMPFNQYGMGQYGQDEQMDMGGQQMDPNWWQNGLQGTGSFLQRVSTPLTTAGINSANPYATVGGLASAGFGSLFNYLGQPGYMQ